VSIRLVLSAGWQDSVEEFSSAGLVELAVERQGHAEGSVQDAIAKVRKQEDGVSRRVIILVLGWPG
jgi:hypothetical protein